MTDNAQEAIGQLLFKLESAFKHHDVELLRDVYTDDVNWTNAFGRHIEGKEKVIQYLKGLFQEPRFTSGQLKGRPEADVQVVTDDVVVVNTYAEIAGQKTTKGDIPLRRNHSLKVLVKTKDNHWRIASEMYMDARDEVTYSASGS